jgi:hypothetical protein
MSDCVEEQTTHHFRGRWHGFGPVRDPEHVLFAVFPDIPRNGDRLTDASFSSNLNNLTQSLGRVLYVSQKTFDIEIVRGAAVDGVCSAHVGKIRLMRADIETPKGTINIRSMCVLDLVEEGDCEGHATMGYSKALNQVSQKQIGKKRKAVRMDLAATFSEIRIADEHRWPSTMDVFRRRMGAPLRGSKPSPSGEAKG